MANKTNLKSNIKNIFIQSDCKLTDEELTKFYEFYLLFNEYNKPFDLSRITKFEDIIIKHFIDSIYFLRYYKLPASIVDIGTGAGFPGIPLKIISPETHIILAEPRHKRVKFMEMVIEKLELKNIDIYPHKVDSDSYLKVNGVITRAFESVNDSLERCFNFLPVNGQIFFMKGPGVKVDIKNISIENKKNYKISKEIAYILPKTPHQRSLLVCTKISSDYKRTYKFISAEKVTMGNAISSPENKQFKLYKKIIASGGIKKTGLTIISGKKIIIELLKTAPHLVESLLLFDGYQEIDDQFNQKIEKLNKEKYVYILKKSLFNEIDLLKINSPLLIVNLPEIPEWNPTTLKGCIILIPFQDPSNVGSIIRSAMAFNVNQIVILKEAANPFHPKSIRASSGTVFFANIKKGPSIDEIPSICKQNNMPIFCLDKNGKPVKSVTFPDNFIILPGIEGPGIPESLKSNSIAIPINNSVESLNATIAASIAIFIATQK